MRNMKSSISRGIVLTLLVSSHFVCQSQSVSNSAYNVFGIGTLDQQGLVAYEAMAYAGIGSRTADLVNLKNPAALNAIQGFTQQFDVGISYSGLSQQSNEASSSSTFGGLHDLNYWFRVSPRTALTLGVAKLSDTNYDILDSQSGGNALGRSDSRYLGEGGSSQFYVAGGYSLTPNLHLGLRSNVVFGSFTSDELVSIFDPGASLEIKTERGFVSANFEAGLQYQFLLSENAKMVIGGTYKTGRNAAMNEEVVIISDSGNQVDSLSSSEASEIYLPRRVGLGLGFESKSLMVNMDYEFENWGANDNPVSFQYKDRFIASFGAQYIRDRFSPNLLNRVAFRLGGGVHSNYIELDNREFLSQYYSLGLGVPLSRGAAAINLTYQFYSTGTLSSDLIKENANTISVSVSIKDFWFRKRAFD